MPNDIDVLIEDDRWALLDFEKLAKRAVQATLEDQRIATGELSVLGCDDIRIAVLNSDFRGKATATNVLSWPKADLSPHHAGDLPNAPQPDHSGIITLGDIALAYDTCVREAEQQGKPVTDHVAHLLVHGTLHLLGYDHIRDLDATRMEALEIKILGSMGLPDPY